MKVFLTGASGYLGSNLLLALSRSPDIAKVVCLVHTREKLSLLREILPEETMVQYVVGDLNDPATYGAYLEDADIVVHAAAVRGIEFCESHPDEAERVNVSGTRKLLEAALQSGVKRILYCSSQAVYGAKDPYPYREDCAPRPDTVYGRTKYRGELLVRETQQRGMQFLILRFSRLYGSGTFMREEELPHRFARYAVSGVFLPVYHNGEDVVDLLHIRDAVASIEFFLHPARNHCWNDVYNVGSGSPLSVLSLAGLYQELCRKLGLGVPALRAFPPSPGRKPKILGLDVTKLKKAGWTPAISLEEGIRELLLVYQKARNSASPCG